MKPIKWILLVAFLGLVFGQMASALETEQYCAVFDNKSTDWVQTKTVPQFDPTLGTLTEVRLTANACGYQLFQLDSEDTAEQCWTVRTSGVLTTPMPNGDVLTLNLPPDQPERVREFCLDADSDNETDFIGGDSYRDFISDCTDEEMQFFGADLADWIGPGTVSFETTADATTIVDGPGSFDQSVRTNAEETICVVYVYEPPIKLCIDGYKFNGSTDEGLEGWTIQLKDASGAVIKEATTDIDGYYKFCELAPGTYTVCEVTKPNWTPITPTCVPVELIDQDETVNFRNIIKQKPPCGTGCPFFIKNELYTASCKEVKVVDASKGILANDLKGSIVLDPESITIDPKYGSIEVYEDGAFVYDPTGATGLYSGVYVIFKYNANNGFCDAKYLGIAKIQIRC